MIIHGDTVGGKSTRIFNVWRCMIDRCGRKNNTDYKRYGGRGISVCAEWREYGAFKAWALQNGYADDLEIDRINNDGNYTPENCRFATHRVNSGNRTASIFATINGRTQCMAEWARESGVSKFTIYSWISRHGIRGATERVKRAIEQKARGPQPAEELPFVTEKLGQEDKE